MHESFYCTCITILYDYFFKSLEYFFICALIFLILYVVYNNVLPFSRSIRRFQYCLGVFIGFYCIICVQVSVSKNRIMYFLYFFVDYWFLTLYRPSFNYATATTIIFISLEVSLAALTGLLFLWCSAAYSIYIIMFVKGIPIVSMKERLSVFHN